MVQRSSDLTECKEILRRYFLIVYCIICVLTPHKCLCLKKKRLDGDLVKTIVKSCCSHHSCLFCFVASRKCNDRDVFVNKLSHTLCMSNARVLFPRFESVQQSKKFFDFAHGLVFIGNNNCNSIADCGI